MNIYCYACGVHHESESNEHCDNTESYIQESEKYIEKGLRNYHE